MFKTLRIAVACALGSLSLAAEAGAASPDHGLLSGRTGQGRAIRLTLRRDSVQLKRFTIQLRCRDGSLLVDDESGFLPSRLRSGRLRDHQAGDTDDVWIRGALTGRTLRGAVRVHDHVGKVQCESHWVPFHARLGG